MNRTMCLIDGVQVTRKIYERRKFWGEYPGASYRVDTVNAKQAVRA
jgi:hypothetical protein